MRSRDPTGELWPQKHITVIYIALARSLASLNVPVTPLHYAPGWQKAEHMRTWWSAVVLSVARTGAGRLLGLDSFGFLAKTIVEERSGLML